MIINKKIINEVVNRNLLVHRIGSFDYFLVEDFLQLRSKGYLEEYLNKILNNKKDVSMYEDKGYPRVMWFMKDIHEDIGCIRVSDVLNFWESLKSDKIRGYVEEDEFNIMVIGVKINSLDMVRFGIKKGVHVDQTGVSGETCLHLAAEEGRLDIARFLLEKGADMSRRAFNGCTPKGYAWASDEDRMVNFFEIKEQDGK